MDQSIQVRDIFRVPDDRVGESVVDEVFDAAAASRMKETHPIASRCDRFVGRDPADNLIVISNGEYHYWDHESDELIRLGSDPAQFVTSRDV